VVDAVTWRDGTQLASVRSDAGPSVTAVASAGELEAGMEVALESQIGVGATREGVRVTARPARTSAPAAPVAPLRGVPLEQQTIPALLERQAGTHGDRPLLSTPEVKRTYAQVRDTAAASAGALRAAGVEPGDRVAAMCRNRVELLDLVLGCAWSGAIAVPINIAARGPQLEHVLGNSGARILVLDSELIDVLGAVGRPDGLEQVWALDGVPDSAPAG
jgi:carnitine-CoA ligase